MKKLSVGVLGATGIIGEHYVRLLENHPWFELKWVAASPRSAHKKYDTVTGCRYCSLEIQSLDAIASAAQHCDLLFSALPSPVAAHYDPLYAAAGLPVFSHASCHRKDPLIPLIIPEINPDHLKLIPLQQKEKKWNKGFIVAKPTCSIQSFLLPLAPLDRLFSLQSVAVTTLQALSGAGSSLSSHTIFDNIIPYIAGEEEKVEWEPLKILGTPSCARTDIKITATCHRVPVLHGHLVSIHASFRKKTSPEEILKVWQETPSLNLPSAPKQAIIYQECEDRPQVRLDRDVERGMSATVGRLRPCTLFDYRLSTLSHNAVRGGAGGGLLTAELLYQEGYLG